MKKIVYSILALCMMTLSLSAREYNSDDGNYIKVAKPNQSNHGTLFRMGTAMNPAGSTLEADSYGVLLNGRPMLPVMGEFHYTRFPETEWRKELLKMKAGGINIIASYIFWIHHEEIEGKYNWEGRRNLRKFIELCRELDLMFVLRIGPWCHGEARNGGFPEWMVDSGIKLRSNEAAYLEKVQTWFTQIFNQVQGLMWKDGGPIIAVQLENEYRGRGEHLMTLKKMVQEIGLDAPLYTRTGWPKLSSPVPFGEILPLYGDYADGFWDRSVKEMPGDYGKSYTFRSFRNSTVIATEQLPKQSDKDNPDDIGYPYFTCELGGGMMTSYHRRISINPMDVFAMSLVRVGSGSNLPGYYMYHGGTNPTGEATTMNEMQESKFTNHNDLPVKTYDFQAPLGEFGQINPHYHLLRRLHLFLHDFGDELALMAPSFPQNAPTDFNDDTVLRWSVRSNGENGFVFVNNYHRLKQLKAKEGVQFTIDLPDEKITFPGKPMTVPSEAAFFMPFNMKLGDSKLVYSTAQPIVKIKQGNNWTFVFAQNKDIPADFVFEDKGITVDASKATTSKRDNRIYFEDVKPGAEAAIQLKQPNNATITILLLDEANALALWKGKLAGEDRLFLTTSGLTFNRDELQLEDETGARFSVSIYPAPGNLSMNGKTLSGKANGLFTRYEIPVSRKKPIKAKIVQTREASLPLREIKMGRSKVAAMPVDDDFNGAAQWKVVLSEEVDAQRDIYLRFPYVGDVARVYGDGELLTDNFYNGKAFEVGLKHFAPVAKQELTIDILPLQKDAPVYYPQTSLPDFSKSRFAVELPRVEVIEKCCISLHAKP